MSDMRRDVEGWLAETGLPWAIESGARHMKVKISGKLVAIFPQAGRYGGAMRARLNIRAQIRRAAKEHRAA